MTLDDRSRTAMTFDPDHLATLNEAATPGRWGCERLYDNAHVIYNQDTPDDDVAMVNERPDSVGRERDDAALIVYLRNHVDAILAQAAELAALRARVEEADVLDRALVAHRVGQRSDHESCPQCQLLLGQVSARLAGATPAGRWVGPRTSGSPDGTWVPDPPDTGSET